MKKIFAEVEKLDRVYAPRVHYKEVRDKVVDALKNVVNQYGHEITKDNKDITYTDIEFGKNTRRSTKVKVLHKEFERLVAIKTAKATEKNSQMVGNDDNEETLEVNVGLEELSKGTSEQKSNRETQTDSFVNSNADKAVQTSLKEISEDTLKDTDGVSLDIGCNLPEQEQKSNERVWKVVDNYISKNGKDSIRVKFNEVKNTLKGSSGEEKQTIRGKLENFDNGCIDIKKQNRAKKVLAITGKNPLTQPVATPNSFEEMNNNEDFKKLYAPKTEQQKAKVTKTKSGDNYSLKIEYGDYIIVGALNKDLDKLIFVINLPQEKFSMFLI